MLCFAFGAVLTLIDPASGRAAVSRIDWSTVLLVGGIITFVGVLQKMGSVELLGEAAGNAGAPILAALAICMIGALVSAFASTTGILAALVPLALPLVASGDVAGWALISALARLFLDRGRLTLLDGGGGTGCHRRRGGPSAPDIAADPLGHVDGGDRPHRAGGHSGAAREPVADPPTTRAVDQRETFGATLSRLHASKGL